MKKNIATYFIDYKALSSDDIGMARNTVFQEIRPGAGIKTGELV